MHHRAATEMLEIIDIGTEGATHRAETGDIGAARLIDQDAVNGIGGEVVLDLAKEPGAEGGVIIAGDAMRAAMLIFDPRLGMTKGIPAWHQHRTGKEVAKAAQAQMHLQARLAGQQQTAFQVTRPALLLLLMNRAHNAVNAQRANLLKVALHDFGVKQRVKICNSNVHNHLPGLGTNRNTKIYNDTFTHIHGLQYTIQADL